MAASARLDWRFLLPRPDLQRVGVAGDLEPSLATALGAATRTFSAATVDDASLDLLVMRDPDPRKVPALTSALRPGGTLYVEVSAGRVRDPRWLRRWEKVLAAAGVREVTTYWLVPHAREQRVALPLHAPRAARMGLGRAGGPAKAVAMSAAVRVAAATGLLPLAVREAALIGTWPA
jgi:hypothetical protein